jgi:AcrR family transcriptional regulator
MAKAQNSKEYIIQECTRVMNIEGVNLTLNQLANRLGISRGRINHYFRTKDALFIAIAQAYEQKLITINEEFDLKHKDFSFHTLEKRYAIIMDHQFDYRCAITYIVSSGHDDPDLSKHISETYKGNKEKLVQLLSAMVHLDMLTKDILEKDNLETFIFDFINIFTNWVLHYNLYDRELPYEQVKAIYLKAIMEKFEVYKNKNQSQKKAKDS